MITAEMTIAQVLKEKPESAQVLRQFGMHCIGCAVASGESIGDAAKVHGIDLQTLLTALNK
jgi:hybrid cluster-associated redox disulfide protein